MHSNIFQISDKPISEGNFLYPEYFYEDANDFADYIGDEYEDEARTEKIQLFAEHYKDLFDLDGEVLVFKGLGSFLQDWAEALKEAANKLNGDNILKELNLYRLERMTQTTHTDNDARFFIEDWNCYAGDFGDFISWLSHLDVGTCLYIGAVIDFHF